MSGVPEPTDHQFTAACIRLRKALRRYRSAGLSPTPAGFLAAESLGRAAERLHYLVADRLNDDDIYPVSGSAYLQAKGRVLSDLSQHRALRWDLVHCLDEFTTAPVQVDLARLTQSTADDFKARVMATRGHAMSRKLKKRLRGQAGDAATRTLTGLNQLVLGKRQSTNNDHMCLGSLLLRGPDGR